MVRKANPQDARAIHEAHMASIRGVCSKDHSAEEIAGWGGRPFSAEKWTKIFERDAVWVVELEGKIEGFGDIEIFRSEGGNHAYIQGLYLTEKAVGKNYGREILDLMLGEAKSRGARYITLEATITAHEFYKRMGFVDVGPQIRLTIGGSPVRCFPMRMNLR